MMPIIITKDKDGNLVITEAELRQIVEQAYKAGYADGRVCETAYPGCHPITWTDRDHVTITCETPSVTLYTDGSVK